VEWLQDVSLSSNPNPRKERKEREGRRKERKEGRKDN
jgi:hypothetical protein